MFSADEITKHGTPSSCWLVINGKVYDVTAYLDLHPGGAAILLKQGGQDATFEFRKIHSPDILQFLPKDICLGEVDPATVASLPLASASNADTNPNGNPNSRTSTTNAGSGPPHISHCIALPDFEPAAKAVLSPNAYSYVSSSANSGLAHAANLSSWRRVSFRPRIWPQGGVARASARTSILGAGAAFPFYCSAMGQLGRAHDGGEVALVRALARRGVHGLLSTVSTQSMEEVMEAFEGEKRALEGGGDEGKGASVNEGKPSTGAGVAAAEELPPAQLHFQLYIPNDRSVAVDTIRRAKAAGFRSLWVTVDTPTIGKRTIDRRIQAQEALAMGLPVEAEKAGFGMRSHVDGGQLNAALTWADLVWIREAWGDGPVVVKGVQSAEDARLALAHGCQGIVLSNHGGRQAHSAPDALTTLLEIRTYCPEVLGRLEVLVDGGCRDGADVLKALCLGATAVGIARPFFYALGAYGEKGVERCCDSEYFRFRIVTLAFLLFWLFMPMLILRGIVLAEELVLNMKLIGMNSLDQASPDRVNAMRLYNEMWRPEKGRL
ncbi:Uu.00g144770.m01.CDS01 [Anthostomella pinea]|uniref:Uu.00g144770.m01.CDS01 n=1 Tax=Anthostomella pinea TaxID=933095 RepID=A0AAI8YJE1_9PEZI|nr:Uu.00g144770.m01.CDS01 [Anthostomella pinea]